MILPFYILSSRCSIRKFENENTQVKKMENFDKFYEKFPGSYVAYISFSFAVIFMFFSVLLYNDPTFSIFTHYISDLGASTKGSSLVWNISMIITAPLRVIFGFYLLMFLKKRGANEKSIKITGYTIIIAAVGTVIIALNPHDISRMLHLTGAFIYFFGVVIIQINLSQMELKVESMPKYLPASGFLVVINYALFISFEVSEIISSIFRLLACFFEWMALFSILGWLLIHGLYLHRIK